MLSSLEGQVEALQAAHGTVVRKEKSVLAKKMAEAQKALGAAAAVSFAG